MKILIDANVIVTLLTRRDDPFLRETDEIIKRCADGRIIGYVALQTVPMVWYVLRRFPPHERRVKLKSICNLLNLAATDMDSIQQALENIAFRDFEDNLQDCCAQSVGADYIVTANVRDYEGHSVVKAVTPTELLEIMDDGSLEVHEPSVAYEPFGGVSLMNPHWHVAFQRRTA